MKMIKRKLKPRKIKVALKIPCNYFIYVDRKNLKKISCWFTMVHVKSVIQMTQNMTQSLLTEQI